MTALLHPDSPLPNEWHPLQPLSVSDPVSPLTQWKFAKAKANPMLCMGALSGAATMNALDDEIDSENCGITSRVSIALIGGAQIDPIETACSTALSLAMWEEHSLQPRAKQVLGTTVTRIDQIGSYSCRRIRTTSEQAQRWSTHARAQAIDVTGFRFADQQRIRLIDDWIGSEIEAVFLRTVRDDACKWFGLTLSPDFNALHADHFHLQVDGRGGCR